jgi:hypothetical protein
VKTIFSQKLPAIYKITPTLIKRVEFARPGKIKAI